MTVTQSSQPLSAQAPGCRGKGGVWGADLVPVGKPYDQFRRLNRVFPKAAAFSNRGELLQAPWRHLSASRPADTSSLTRALTRATRAMRRGLAANDSL